MSFSISPTNVVTVPPSHCQVPNESMLYHSSGPGYFEVADDFRLVTAGTVDSACWWGLFFSTFTLEPHDFELRYYADDSVNGPGVPGTLIASFSESGGTLSVANVEAAGGLIEFCGAHAPLSMSASTRIWISVRERLQANSTVWGWHEAAGNGRLVSRADLDDWSMAAATAKDVAFCLNVPLADLALCPADIDANGAVNVTDLLALLAAWGVCPAPCLPDINGDGVVNVSDLLELLARWGVCP